MARVRFGGDAFRLIQLPGWLGAGCLIGLFVAFFGEALWLGTVLAFRDTAHYYYPLVDFVLAQWRQGRIPLWNPYDHLGSPLAADPTAFVFYPLSVLFAVGRSTGEGINLFIVAHLWLAAWGSYLMARAWRASVAGGILASMAYTFGGIVLFQCHNLVYLVGASWLPLATWAWDRALRYPRPAHTAIAGLTLALLILGGDLQTAYHVCLLWLAYGPLARDVGAVATGTPPQSQLQCLMPNPPSPRTTLVARRRHLSGPTDMTECAWAVAPKTRLRQSKGFFRTWLVAVVIALGVSACLWIPAWEFAILSDRHVTAEPRSVYEFATWWVADVGRGEARRPQVPPVGSLLGRTQPGTHHDAVFQFSVAPTRWGEFFWPNLSGRLFPENHRWLAALGAEDRIWTPSLYMGVIPALFGLATFRLRRAESAWQRWLSWVAMVSLLASLGRFGLGFVGEYVLALSQHGREEWQLPVGPSFGGVYWLATILLPGYVSFRYPAKWLVVTGFALSQLAAQIFQGSDLRNRRAIVALALLVGCSSLAMLGLTYLWWEIIHEIFSRGQPDPAFGPVIPAGAVTDVTWAFIQAAIVALTLAAVVLWLPKWLPVVALFVTPADLTLANRWMAVSIPEPELASPPALAEVFHSATQPVPEVPHPEGIPIPFPRFYRSAEEVAPQWREFASSRRLIEICAWQRDSLFSKFHLLFPVGSLSPGVASRVSDWQFALWVARRPPKSASAETKREGSRALAAQFTDQSGWYRTNEFPGRLVPPGASFALVPERDRVENMVLVVGPLTFAVPTGFSLWRKLEPPPFAWFPEKLRILPEVENSDPRLVWERTAEVLYPEGHPRDLKALSVLEFDTSFWTSLASFGESTTGKFSDENLLASWLVATIFAPAQQTDLATGLFEAVAHWLYDMLGRSSVEKRTGENLGEFVFSNPAATAAELKLSRFEPGQVIIEVTSSKPGVLILAQQWFPGWRAVIRPVGGDRPDLIFPVWRANRAMQAVAIPPGSWVVRMEFRPVSLQIGLALSVGTMFVLTFWLAITGWSLAQFRPPPEVLSRGLTLSELARPDRTNGEA